MSTPQKYRSWLAALKADILQCKLQTALQVNRNMLILYWYIGKQIDDKIKQEGWGSRIVEQLSADLQKTFPDLKGFSTRNLLYMQQFSAAYPNLLITQQPVAQLEKTTKKTKKAITQQAVAQLAKAAKNAKTAITQQPVAQLGEYVLGAEDSELVAIPWGHHTLLLDKIEAADERIWYIQKTIENKWSRNVLQYQLQTDLYKRQHKTKKSSNFHLITASSRTTSMGRPVPLRCASSGASAWIRRSTIR